MSHARVASRTPTLKIGPPMRVPPSALTGRMSGGQGTPAGPPSFVGEVRGVLQDVKDLLEANDERINMLFARLEPILAASPTVECGGPPEQELHCQVAHELASCRTRLQVQLSRLVSLESLIAL
jgi:hypothetical protein